MSDFLTLLFALIGIVLLLYYIMFRLFMWGEKGGVFIVPLYPSEKEPRTRISNIKKLFELTGFDKISVLLIVDYGIEKKDIDTIKNIYRGEEKVFFCSANESKAFLERLSKKF
ncbi:MAG TPA: hypothetical protein VFC76_01350 [Oscillospiraceae bacterium]|nr:hypothetical protein [Oscillospiraceae bacterium]